MYLRVDLQEVPPLVEVHEPEDFTSFKVVLVPSTHTWVEPEALTRLAGRARDDAWRERLAAMTAYARRQGWTDGQGRLRAHVETVVEPDEPVGHPERDMRPPGAGTAS
ncbi:hypothetical protein [Streptomyces sp. NPDC046909]|uniref:hypothetical protein n=1 Tax=Streptomyces sp. NPDC046909 TaxID=3155617 RepID=UPI0033CD13F0